MVLYPSVKCPSWYKLHVSSESETGDDLLEQAYATKLMGGILKDVYVEQKEIHEMDKFFFIKWRSVHEKEDERTNEVGKKLNSLISCLDS